MIRSHKVDARPIDQSDTILLCSICLLAILSLLNANILLTGFGIPPLLSWLSFLLALIVIFRIPIKIGKSLAILIFSILIYLLFGSFSSLVHNDTSQIGRVFFRYSGALLIIVAFYSYTRYCIIGRISFKPLGITIFVSLVIASLSVYSAPYLPQSFRMETWDGNVHRYSGFWMNPNESAMISLLALGCGVSLLKMGTIKTYFRYVVIIALILSAGAVILTYSKSGAAGLLFLTAMFVLFYSRKLRINLSIFLIVVLSTIALFFSWDNIYIYLSDSQLQRVEQVLGVIGGDLSEENSSDRYKNWKKGIIAFENNSLFGEGLGTLDTIRSSYSEDHGVHHTILLFAGESGLLAALAFTYVMILITFLTYITRKKKIGFAIFCYVVVLFLDIFLTHTTILVKYHAVGLGIVLALYDSRMRSKSTLCNKKAILTQFKNGLPKDCN